MDRMITLYIKFDANILYQETRKDKKEKRQKKKSRKEVDVLQTKHTRRRGGSINYCSTVG